MGKDWDRQVWITAKTRGQIEEKGANPIIKILNKNKTIDNNDHHKTILKLVVMKNKGKIPKIKQFWIDFDFGA